MIEINLLPEELRIKRKGEGLDSKYFLYLVPLAFALLIAAHVFLFVMLFAKNYHLKNLEKQWKAFEPQRKSLEALKKESDLLLQDFTTTQEFFSKRITWADKLNKLSLNLPSGVWFSDISLTSKELVLKGSVVSLQKEEMTLINNFLDKLKNDKAFATTVETFDLGSVLRRNVGSYEILDFTITGKLRPH